ncbi:hypothetical protein M885DRAFT_585537 [Pelagophyceae sp. CCMP2097]|nr:hypothetical protein M885DRAFT_585537 [Pelagophyceae sp. CCMP2097]
MPAGMAELGPAAPWDLGAEALGEDAVRGASAPWNSCKFVNATVAFLTSSPTDGAAKLEAVRHTAHSLGGTHLAPNYALGRRADALLVAFYAALRHVADHPGEARRLSCTLVDVDIMLRPRPVATFAHMFTLVCSRAGVACLQGYGAGVVSAREAFDKYVAPATVVLSESAAGGHWTAQANAAYARAFCVDLSASGHMRLGSQLDALLKVEIETFTAATVAANFRLLPTYNGPALPCPDDDVAAGCVRPLNGFGERDGGAPFRYVPRFAAPRCGGCGAAPAKALRCARCRAAWYCGGCCQAKHWPDHKAACKQCATWLQAAPQ